MRIEREDWLLGFWALGFGLWIFGLLGFWLLGFRLWAFGLWALGFGLLGFGVLGKNYIKRSIQKSKSIDRGSNKKAGKRVKKRMNEIEAINLALDEGKQQGKKEMLEWLEKERDKIREYNSNQKEESDFMKGWLKGSSDGAEALFEAAKKRADEK